MHLSNVFLAGTFASLGGLFGKLSGLSTYETIWINYIGHLTCFILMLAFNGAMWTLYVKSLQNNSSFKATVISSSVNFFLSGLFGVVIFGEATTLFWWTGLVFILIGIVLINS